MSRLFSSAGIFISKIFKRHFAHCCVVSTGHRRAPMPPASFSRVLWVWGHLWMLCELSFFWMSDSRWATRTVSKDCTLSLVLSYVGTDYLPPLSLSLYIYIQIETGYNYVYECHGRVHWGVIGFVACIGRAEVYPCDCECVCVKVPRCPIPRVEYVYVY